MSLRGDRRRTRLTPLKKTGPVKLGFYNSAITNNQGVPLPGQWAPNELNQRDHTYGNLHHTYELCVDELHEGPPYLSGGPFSKLKSVVSHPYGGVYGSGTRLRSDKKQRYVGGFRAPEDAQFKLGIGFPNQLSIMTDPFSRFPPVGDWGNKAFDRTKPRIQAAGGFVFSAELRDAPRQLKTTARAFKDIWRLSGGSLQPHRVMAPKNVADHFLNVQFGWKPFLKDILDFDYVIQNYSKLSASRKDRNDKWIRKAVPLLKGIPQKTQIDHGLGNPLDPYLVPEYFAGDPYWNLWEETTTNVTGVGSFKYYLSSFDANLPDFDSGWNQAMRVLAITGARISPSNVYHAIPWTWAADWVTNVGDHVDHYNDLLIDNIACKYCYVMMRQVKTRKLTVVLPWYHGDTTILTFTRTIETKERAEGSSPYGFSLSWNDLTPTQIAIAGALGISRKK